MYIEVELQPLPLLLWLLFLAFGFLYWLVIREQSRWTYLLPVVLLVLLLQPRFSLKQTGEKAGQRILLDTSYSSLAVDHELRTKAIADARTKFSIPPAETYSMQRSRLDDDEWRSPGRFRSLVDGMGSPTRGGAGVIITDVSRYDGEAQDNVIYLPIVRDLSGLFDLRVDPACYLGRKCTVDVFVHAHRAAIIRLNLPGRKALQKKVAAGFHGRIRFNPAFAAGGRPGNIYGWVQLKAEGAVLVDKMPFILSVQKGVPSGYAVFPRTNILSWRLSHLLQQHPFWKLTIGRDLTAVRSRRHDFYVAMVNQAIQPGKTSRPVLFVWPEGDARNLPAGWTKKQQNIFTAGASVLYLWPLPARRRNIFIDMDGAAEAIQVFSRSLQADRPPFMGSYVEVGRPLRLNQGVEPRKDLLFDGAEGKRTIQRSVDPASRRYYFVPPFLGEYSYGSLAFEAGVQRQELLSVYDYLAGKRQRVPQLETQLQNLKLPEKTAEVVTSYIRLGFSQTERMANIAWPVWTFLLTLLLALCLFWYMPSRAS